MTTPQDLSGVAEPLFLPLYIRALESQRTDALIKDEKDGRGMCHIFKTYGRFPLLFGYNFFSGDIFLDIYINLDLNYTFYPGDGKQS